MVLFSSVWGVWRRIRWFHFFWLFLMAGVVLALQIEQLPGEECSTGTTRFTRNNPLCIDSATPFPLVVGLTAAAWGATIASGVAWWRARSERRA